MAGSTVYTESGGTWTKNEKKTCAVLHTGFDAYDKLKIWEDCSAKAKDARSKEDKEKNKKVWKTWDDKPYVPPTGDANKYYNQYLLLSPVNQDKDGLIYQASRRYSEKRGDWAYGPDQLYMHGSNGSMWSSAGKMLQKCGWGTTYATLTNVVAGVSQVSLLSDGNPLIRSGLGKFSCAADAHLDVNGNWYGVASGKFWMRNSDKVDPTMGGMCNVDKLCHGKQSYDPVFQGVEGRVAWCVWFWEVLVLGTLTGFFIYVCCLQSKCANKGTSA